MKHATFKGKGGNPLYVNQMLCESHVCGSLRNVHAELQSTGNSTCAFKQVCNILTLKVSVS